ncbi:MAG: transcription antitermination factor NusB [Rickettsiaceae bacterium]|jgi:N utilization substance protein B|nr:transcription antitermination factor NusB [Rickettsiaceae bacterium]
MLSSQLNSKSIARIAAIQTLYQFETDKHNTNIETLLLQIIDFYRDKDIKSDYELDSRSLLKLKPSFNYLKELVKYTHDHLEEIDQIIENHLSNEWTINNLPKLLFATLRVSICEMKYFPETPRNVIINEYTDIASDMLDEGQVGFVNSVLDKYADKKR